MKSIYQGSEEYRRFTDVDSPCPRRNSDLARRPESPCHSQPNEERCLHHRLGKSSVHWRQDLPLRRTRGNRAESIAANREVLACTGTSSLARVSRFRSAPSAFIRIICIPTSSAKCASPCRFLFPHSRRATAHPAPARGAACRWLRRFPAPLF